MVDANPTGTVSEVSTQLTATVNAAPAKSLRNRILEAKDIKEEIIDIPEWEDAKILVRGLTGKQRAKLLNAVAGTTGKPDPEKLYPEIMVMCCFDPDSREAVFTPADKESINSKSGIVLERIAQIVMSLSGLTDQSMAELRKN